MMFAQANSLSIVGIRSLMSRTLDGEDQPNSLFGMIRNTHKLGGENVLWLILTMRRL